MEVGDGHSGGAAEPCGTVDVDRVALLEQRVQPCHGAWEAGAQAGGVKVHDRAPHDLDVPMVVAAVLDAPKVNLELLPVLIIGTTIAVSERGGYCCIHSME